MWMWFINGFKERRFVSFIFRLSIIVAFIGVIAGAFFFLSQKNYFRRLWEINADSLSEYIVDINAGARGAYTLGALGAFEDHPLTGVGLGASGFYIYQNLPDWALTTVPEIAKQLTPESRLYPNPKNLYARLLAETGLFGFVLFLAFQFGLLGDALSLLRWDAPWARFAAIAGVFAWVAVALYNFTQDSLTTPNIWIVSGIIVGLAAKSEGFALQKNKEAS
jgi:O-antigen ligase